MIVGFNNMLVFGTFEKDKHYVIRVSEDLDEEDTVNIPSKFLNRDDSGELFDIVTLKPTTTTTTTTTRRPTTFIPRYESRIRDMQREALPGFDPDRQSFNEFLHEVSLNMSRLMQSIDEQ